MKTLKTIPPEVAAVIPWGQYEVTAEHLDTFTEAIQRIEQQLQKCPKLRETDGMNRTLVREHPAILHYFYGGTDMYICEYDPKDGIMFGFAILNGDLQNAEWGYIDLAEIITIPVMNLDYHFEEQSIEAALFRQYPRHFKKPQSLMD
jgi:hypothetical protein